MPAEKWITTDIKPGPELALLPNTQKNGRLGMRLPVSLVLRMLWYFNQVDSHTFTDDAMDVDVTIVVLALCKERESVSTPSHYSFDHLQ